MPRLESDIQLICQNCLFSLHVSWHLYNSYSYWNGGTSLMSVGFYKILLEAGIAYDPNDAEVSGYHSIISIGIHIYFLGWHDCYIIHRI